MSCVGNRPSWTDELVIYAHIGDLHIVAPDMPNYRDFLSIVADIEAIGATTFDFVFLPGDNADNGRDDQYRLVAAGLRKLSIPVFAITGDHDMESGSIEPFRRALEPRRLPHTRTIRGIECVFLDMSGPGRGGPDFRLPADQVRHLEDAIEAAKREARGVAVFMHTYPADLVEREERAAVTAVLADPAVRLVDMGHTHYNELANDGRTIFAATRSTGQIEEGVVGYSITAIDDGGVSWRFKPLRDANPFVLVTSPVDGRLRTNGATPDPRIVHAVVLGRHPVARCEWRVDDGQWQPMRPSGTRGGFEAEGDGHAQRIEVRATDAAGNIGSDVVEPARDEFRAFARDGSDRDAIEAWPEHHLLGTQLGPNRNGRKW